MEATRPGVLRDRVLACTPDNALPILNRLERVRFISHVYSILRTSLTLDLR
jgi:hypothetical protein